MMTQAQPFEIKREKPLLCRCVRQNATGRGRMVRESGKRGAAARRVKNLKNNLKPARFLKFSFFSLFFIYLLSIYLFKINNLRFPRPPSTPKIRKESRHKTRHKIFASL